jgi:hypothetical protein
VRESSGWLKSTGGDARKPPDSNLLGIIDGPSLPLKPLIKGLLFEYRRGSPGLAWLVHLSSREQDAKARRSPKG